ncbi:hypothetical protein [Bradyrhizobium sp. I1.7.5]|uniref:hypothetical protein n=1 Tax=Bradyrhizobium sp. I1.7.5 TaxID=3156363 RepID=UPI0033946803
MPNRADHYSSQQPGLFFELVETIVTRDRVTVDAVLIAPPPGRGWRVHDAHRERHTTWTRRRPIIVSSQWRHRC